MDKDPLAGLVSKLKSPMTRAINPGAGRRTPAERRIWTRAASRNGFRRFRNAVGLRLRDGYQRFDSTIH